MYAVITSQTEPITGKRMVLHANLKDPFLRQRAATMLLQLRRRHYDYNARYPDPAMHRERRQRYLDLCEGVLYALEQIELHSALFLSLAFLELKRRLQN